MDGSRNPWLKGVPKITYVDKNNFGLVHIFLFSFSTEKAQYDGDFQLHVPVDCLKYTNQKFAPFQVEEYGLPPFKSI